MWLAGYYNCFYSSEDCKIEFRFYRSEIYELCDAFEIPNETRCYNGVKVDFLPGIALQWCIGSSCRQNSLKTN